jgi:hypothetical protein
MKKVTMILLFAMANSAQAQTPSGIVGVVSDPAGFGIPGVEVSARSLETDRSVPPVKTTDKGEYGSPARCWQIQCHGHGVHTVTDLVKVQTGNVLTEPFPLNLAETEVSIDVQGDPPDIFTPRWRELVERDERFRIRA